MFGLKKWIVGAGLVLAACGAPGKPGHDVDFSDATDVGDAVKADGKQPVGSYKSLGAIRSGDIKEFYHSGTPVFRSYYFDANQGDEVTLDVAAEDADAETWIIDAAGKSVAYNDDKSASSYDSHLKQKLAASGRYRILMQEYAQDPTWFDVTFTLKAGSSGTGGTTPPTDYLSCQKDSDCVAVQNVACCQSWKKVGVTKGKESAYKTANQCTQSNPSCSTPSASQMDAENQKVAECNNGTHKCEVVHPDNIACGGFITNPHACPSPYVCDLPGTDQPGGCVAQCIYNGATYYPGDTFKTSDYCNDCSCGSTGQVACTKKYCPPCDFTTTATRRYKVKDPVQCQTATFLCKVGEHRFDTNCGCGCDKD